MLRVLGHRIHCDWVKTEFYSAKSKYVGLITNDQFPRPSGSNLRQFKVCKLRQKCKNTLLLGANLLPLFKQSAFLVLDLKTGIKIQFCIEC